MSLCTILFHTNNFVGSAAASSDFRDRNGTGVSGNDAMLRHNCFNLLNDFVLDIDVLEHGFDDAIRVFEVRVVKSW